MFYLNLYRSLKMPNWVNWIKQELFQTNFMGIFHVSNKFERKDHFRKESVFSIILSLMKKMIRSIRRMNTSHQKAIKSPEGTQADQNNDLSRKLDQKALFQNVTLSKEDIIQILPLYVQRYFLKVKKWQDISPKSALTLYRASWLKWLVSPLVLYLLVDKENSQLLSPD